LVLWTFEPKTSGPKDQRSVAETVNDLCPFGATAKIFRDRGVRFVCGPTKLEPLRILYFNIFDRAGNLVRVG
jgi:hypothetical protein